MVNTGLTLLWPIAFAMNVKITLSQLRLHVKTVVLDVLYVTSSMSKKKSLKDILVKDVVKDKSFSKGQYTAGLLQMVDQ